MSSQEQQLNGSDSLPYIPLSKDDATADGQSIGKLVSEATQHVSTLVRAEVELAKSEIVREGKKALVGGIFFIVSGVIALYSSFFLFFFFGELLSEWLKRWAAFGIVFVAMLLIAGAAFMLGLRKVKRLKAPERTMTSVRETAAALKPRRSGDDEPTPFGA